MPKMKQEICLRQFEAPDRAEIAARQEFIAFWDKRRPALAVNFFR